MENKNNSPVNIRFVAKTSGIRNLSQNIGSDVKHQKWQHCFEVKQRRVLSSNFLLGANLAHIKNKKDLEFRCSLEGSYFLHFKMSLRHPCSIQVTSCSKSVVKLPKVRSIKRVSGVFGSRSGQRQFLCQLFDWDFETFPRSRTERQTGNVLYKSFSPLFSIEATLHDVSDLLIPPKTISKESWVRCNTEAASLLLIRRNPPDAFVAVFQHVAVKSVGKLTVGTNRYRRRATVYCFVQTN